MRFDIENQLSVAQAFTGAATVSTNSYQKQSAAQDLSIGRQMSLVIYPTVAGGAGSTAVLDVVQADNTALTTNLEVLATRSVAAADLTVGACIEIPIPKGCMDKTHLGFRCTITGGTTTLTADAYIMPSDEVPFYKSFPKIVDADVQ